MLGSIRKFSKSIFAKIFIAIIALPFVLWGMGDVFTSGKQNILVEINNEKISSKEFITYIQKIELTKREIENIGKSRILDDMLSNYISEKIISIEGKNKGIQLTDTSLKNILIVDKNFKKDQKFSRTKYEKFLLENGYSASTYERYLKSIELKGQLLNYYSGGINLPDFIINDLYQKEKQKKEIEFLNLSKIYKQKMIDDNEIQKFYDENKNLLIEKFISFKYLELKPEYLTGRKDFDEEYYDNLDKLENDVLDGKIFDEIINKNKVNVQNIKLINSRRTKQDGTIVNDINSKLFQKIFSIKDLNTVQFINHDRKYYIAEITEEKNINLKINDKDLKKTIEAQLKISFKIKENEKYLERINNKKYNKEEMLKMSQQYNVPIGKTKIDGINDTKEFKPNLVKKIFDHTSGQLFLASDNIVQDNYIIRIIKDTEPKIDKKSELYKKYSKKANANYISKVYKSYDQYINANYKIDINQKVLERLKNSF